MLIHQICYDTPMSHKINSNKHATWITHGGYEGREKEERNKLLFSVLIIQLLVLYRISLKSHDSSDESSGGELWDVGWSSKIFEK